MKSHYHFRQSFSQPWLDKLETEKKSAYYSIKSVVWRTSGVAQWLSSHRACARPRSYPVKAPTAPIKPMFLRKERMLLSFRYVPSSEFPYLTFCLSAPLSLNLTFPMMWGPKSNQQRPGASRRCEQSSDLCRANPGEWTTGNEFQEGTRPSEGWPGPEENPGQTYPSPWGSELHQTLWYYGSRPGDLGEVESVRRDKVCHGLTPGSG